MKEKRTAVEKTNEPETQRSAGNPARSPATASLPVKNGLAGVQQGAGNLAMQRLFRSRAVQAKLTIGGPDDPLEREADRVADQVARMPFSTACPETTFAPCRQPLRMQRTCKECEEEDRVQLKGSPDWSLGAAPKLEARLSSSREGGQPLSEPVRASMEAWFGVDFSQVRVHANTEAVAMNRALGSQAFTRQQDIFYGSEKYRPESKDGLRLLAHELTHVVQQNRTPTNQKPDLQLQREEHTRHESAGRHWYIEADPPTPLVQQGTTVTFRLKNRLDEERRDVSVFESLFSQHPRAGLAMAERPVFGIMVRGGNTPPHRWRVGTRNYPVTVPYTFNFTGHRTVFFEGTPHGESRGPGLSELAQPIHVTYELDVVSSVAAPALEATARSGSAKADLAAIGTTDNIGEVQQLFQRIAIRRALETLSRNKREAFDIEYIYRGGQTYQTPEPDRRVTDARAFAPVYQALVRNRDELADDIENPPESSYIADMSGASPIRTVDYVQRARLAAIRRKRLRQVDLAVQKIEAAYPELGAYHRYRTSHAAGGFLFFEQAVLAALQDVKRDIDDTRYRLVAGEISILDVHSIVNPLLEELGNPSVRTAVQILQSEHSGDDLWQRPGIIGASIALLFIPGIGPFLSAGLGLIAGTAQAVSSWEEAERIATAANAGVARGIFTTGEADEALNRAIWDSVFAVVDAVDFGKALKAMKLVPAARRGARAAGRVTAAVEEQVSEVDEAMRAARRRGEGAVAAERAADAVETAEELLGGRSGTIPSQGVPLGRREINPDIEAFVHRYGDDALQNLSDDQIRAFVSWRRSLSAETQAILDLHPESWRVYANMDPRVRRILTLCDSPCIPEWASEEQGQRIGQVLERLGWPDDTRGLRRFFHCAEDADHLDQMIQRVNELADEVLGQPASEALGRLPADAYHIRSSTQIRRNPGASREGWPPLRIQEDGTVGISYRAQRGSHRLSETGVLRRELERVFGEFPNHEGHHLIPDEVARAHPLSDEAMESGAFDLDGLENGIFLPRNEAGLAETPSLPLHSGSHPDWNGYVYHVLEASKRHLDAQYGSLAEVPEDVLEATMQSVLQYLHNVISTWTTMH